MSEGSDKGPSVLMLIVLFALVWVIAIMSDPDRSPEPEGVSYDDRSERSLDREIRDEFLRE